MATPKLKVYRLDQDYNPLNDNDLQSITGDEFLPIVQKELSPHLAQEMVGVKQRCDSRIVVANEQQSMIFYRQISSSSSESGSEEQNISNPKKHLFQFNKDGNRVQCDDWVLGKGNIDISVTINNSSSSSSSSSSEAATSYILDKKYWDYQIVQQKYESSTEPYQTNYIQFSIGQMFFHDEEYAGTFGNNTYTIDSITVHYSTFSEFCSSLHEDAVLSSSSSSSSSSLESLYDRLRAPFGNIYNGNKSGRYIPENDGTNKMRFYQGNYLYKRRVLPLRCKRILLQGKSDFYVEFGSLSIYFDGLMRPVLMQKISINNGDKYIFKQLQQNLQYNKIFYQTEKQYKITLNDDYYGDNFPKQIFVFYNYVDDGLGDLFDFNYDYANLTQARTINYGYGNDGSIVENEKYDSIFPNDGCYIYKKCEKLAVVDGFGYDENMGDLLLTEKSNSISFSMNNYKFVPDLGYRIYIDGKLICDEMKTSSSSSSSSSSSATQFTVEVVFDDEKSAHTWTITKPDDSISFPKDLMLVFYERYNIEDVFSIGSSSSSSSSSNSSLISSEQYIIGYRVPCYEKVKKSQLFVSSFPNWVKGHLNNDLDVFVGNTQYSGTTLDNGSINSIYPAYQEDGWYAMYPQGSIQFAQEVQEYDYFDIFNYGTQLGSVTVEDNAWETILKSVLPNYFPISSSTENQANYQIFYNKVKYNVAHYDGIYSVLRCHMSNYSVQNGRSHYALLQDDDFEEAKGKYLVMRDDNYIRTLFESNLDEFPKNGEKVETVDCAKAIQVKNGQQDAKINIIGDRVVFVNYIPESTTSNYIPESTTSNYAIISVGVNTVEDNTSSSESSSSESTNQVKIGIKVDNEGVFCVGQEDGTGNIVYQKLPAPLNAYDNADFTQEAWVVNDNSTSSSSSSQSSGIINQDKPPLSRYKCSNDKWYYDIYVQMFSYHYNQNNKVYSVQFVVYKIDN